MNNFTAVIFGVIIFLLAISVAERITEKSAAPTADPMVAERIRPVGTLQTTPAASSGNAQLIHTELPVLTVPPTEPPLPPPDSVIQNEPQPSPLISEALPPKDAPSSAAPVPPPDNFAAGRKIYIAACFSCHETGAAGAPKRGDRPAWRQRKYQGNDLLLAHILNGFNNMPPYAGNPNLRVEEINLALSYLLQ